MDDNFESGPFCKAVLTGLFAGIIASVSSLVFDLLFRYYTGFPYSTIINVSTIIFGINVAVLASGLLYYLLRKSRMGNVIFISAFLLITIFCVMKVTTVERSSNYHETVEFRNLLSGILIITGASCFTLIPALFNNRSFNKHVV